MKKIINQSIYKVGITFLLMASYSSSFAQTTIDASKEQQSFVNYALLCVCGILLLAVVALGGAVINATDVYKNRVKDELKKTLPVIIFFLCLIPFGSSAQTDITPIDKNGIGEALFSGFSIYFYLIVILVEVVAIGILYKTLMTLVGVKLFANADGVKEHAPTFFEKFNKTVPVEKENSLDLAHNYDGIRELDNSVPPWWMWAFYCSVIFGIIYIYRYHISGTAPLQLEELRIEMAAADSAQSKRINASTDNIDESNVVMLDATGVAAGKDLYMKNCNTCHGDLGQGIVGPNLTDDYWIHGGGMSDIFKSIKYGWQDKGMKAWKADFTPTQMAQLGSFIKSIKGTNPAGAKEKQGDLYVEEIVTSTDSLKKDTSALVKK